MSLADEKEPARICFYGDPGSAKTTNLTDLTKLGRMYVIDADGGLKPRALRDFGVLPENVEPYRDISYSSLEGLFWDIKGMLDDDPDHCVGIGVDTATELGQRLLSLIVDAKQGAKISKAEANGLDTEEIDPFFRDIAYYGTLTEQVRRLLRGWKDLSINLGITAHVRRDVDEASGKVMYGPDVNPAIQSLIMGGVDVIAYCRTDGIWPAGFEAGGREGFDVMVADMRKTNDHHAKDRFHATPRVMVNPTFSRIIGYIDGTLTLDNDEQQKAYRELFQDRRAEARRVKEEREAKKAQARGGAAKKTAPAKKTAAHPPADDDSGEGDD